MLIYNFIIKSYFSISRDKIKYMFRVARRWQEWQGMARCRGKGGEDVTRGKGVKRARDGKGMFGKGARGRFVCYLDNKMQQG